MPTIGHITPEQEAAILATPGVRVTYANPAAPGADMGIPISGKPTRKAREKVPLVAAGFDRCANSFTIPLKVDAGDNSRGQKSRIGRAGHERRAVAAVLALGLRSLAGFAADLRGGEPVSVSLTRIGLRQMDLMNAIASLKWVQDTVALFLGRDDGDPLLRWSYGQEVGPAFGVRIGMQSGGLRR